MSIISGLHCSSYILIAIGQKGNSKVKKEERHWQTEKLWEVILESRSMKGRGGMSIEVKTAIVL